MPYNAGSATAGSSFGAVGPRLNSSVSAIQQAMDAEKLRQFRTAMMAQQQGTGLPQGYDAQGIALAPSMPGGGGGAAPVAPTGMHQYVPNAGLNFALNKMIKPGAAVPQGYDAEGNPLDGGGGVDLLGSAMGKGNLKSALVGKALLSSL